MNACGKSIALLVCWSVGLPIAAFAASQASNALRATCSGPFQERFVLRVREGWQMKAGACDRWLPAKVPGTVLGNLVANGVLPDPYYGLNNKASLGRIPDLSTAPEGYYSAEFRTKFRLPAEYAGKVVWMRPEGINYRGDVFLNGKLVAVTAGMFARLPVDVTAVAKPGEENELRVRVRPVDHAGSLKKKTWGAANGEWCNGNDGELGRNVTMLMSAGWDFTFDDGIRDRNTGIWKDITFFATGPVRLDHPFVRTHLLEGGKRAELDVEIEVNNSLNANAPLAAELTVEIPGTSLKATRQMRLFRRECRAEHFKFTLDSPRLWWPRNKGEQALYELVAHVKVAKQRVGSKLRNGADEGEDELRTRFGIREVTSDQSGKDGARQFYVNGRKVFVRGTNWIPEAMLKADDARMAAEMRLTAESGVNLVRLWGGGIAESDYFYQLCDEYGLLVWQEFFMTGDTLHPDDPDLFFANLRQTVLRIRNHCSLAHYVCSNESTEMPEMKAFLDRLDGTRGYMMQSECDGVHDGSPYAPLNPMKYCLDTASPRGSRVCGFNPEYGTVALPPAECCREFMPEELLWPLEANEAAWKYRSGGGFDQLTAYHRDAVNAYGESGSFDDYARKAQAADAVSHRVLWETWNRARNFATGVLFWYNNTPIPQLGGHAWDYSLEPCAAHYAVKNALEPLHAQYDYLSNRVSVASDIVTDRAVEVAAEVWSFDSRKVWEKRQTGVATAERNTEFFVVPFDCEPALLALDRPHFVKLRLFADGQEIGSTFYWRSTSVYAGDNSATGPCVGGFAALEKLPATTLAFSTAERKGRTTVSVRNTGAHLAFMTHVQLRGEDGRMLRPTFYSDNDFALLPGEEKAIEVEPPAGRSFKVSVTAWNFGR